jgi:hypothetical protein
MNVLLHHPGFTLQYILDTPCVQGVPYTLCTTFETPDVQPSELHPYHHLQGVRVHPILCNKVLLGCTPGVPYTLCTTFGTPGVQPSELHPCHHLQGVNRV